MLVIGENVLLMIIVIMCGILLMLSRMIMNVVMMYVSVIKGIMI